MPRVLIATNEPVLAKGLQTVLTAGGLEITDICADVCELFVAVQRSRPDVAILDVSILPSEQLIADLRHAAPKCKLVGWRGRGSTESPERLVEEIQLIASFSDGAATPGTIVDIACSDDERKLVTLLGYGLTNEEIAAAMGADKSTVQKMLGSVSDVLGADDRMELAIYGLSKLKEPSDYEGRQ